MGWGTLTLAGLLVVAGQGSDDVFHTNQRNHTIPIKNIDPARLKDIREMILFVSSDKGKSWQQQGVIRPDKDGFVYYAPADGEYWLRVAVVNQQGKQDPENLQQGSPDLVMVVDTVKPIVKLSPPQRQGEDVSVSWEIQEDHPDREALKLEYQSSMSSGWVSVPITPGPTGTAKFRPGNGGVSVRLTFSDKAKNTSMAIVELGGGAVTPAGFAPGAPGAPAGPSQAGPSPLPPPVAPLPPPVASTPDLRSAPPSVSEPRPPAPLNEPRLNPPPATTSTVDPPARPVASTDNPPANAMASSTVYNQRKPLPGVQYANNRELTLEYELARIGPSGVGSVDLWWTPDDGKTWERAPSPELKDTIKGGHYTRMVELQEGDGVYGFSLVVKSRAGLGKQAPRSGDVPELRVELDTTAPVAQLYQPRPDPMRREALLLSWVAKDKNLSPSPITLEWSERTDGPWQPIAADAPNNGQYTWQLPSGMPVAVYLRLRVRDLAGNEGVAVTPEPQLVDLTEPEGRLVNVTVTPRR